MQGKFRKSPPLDLDPRFRFGHPFRFGSPLSRPRRLMMGRLARLSQVAGPVLSQVIAPLAPVVAASRTLARRLGRRWGQPRLLGETLLGQGSARLRQMLWIGLGAGLGAELWLWDWQLALAGAVGLGSLVGADRLRRWSQGTAGQPWGQGSLDWSAPQQFLVLAVAGSGLAAVNTYWLTAVWTEMQSPVLLAGLAGQSVVLWVLVGQRVRSGARSTAPRSRTGLCASVLVEQLRSEETIVRLDAVQSLGQGLELGASGPGRGLWQPEERPWAIATLQALAAADPDRGVRQLAAWHLRVRGLGVESPVEETECIEIEPKLNQVNPAYSDPNQANLAPANLNQVKPAQGYAVSSDPTPPQGSPVNPAHPGLTPTATPVNLAPPEPPELDLGQPAFFVPIDPQMMDLDHLASAPVPLASPPWDPVPVPVPSVVDRPLPQAWLDDPSAH